MHAYKRYTYMRYMSDRYAPYERAFTDVHLIGVSQAYTSQACKSYMRTLMIYLYLMGVHLMGGCLMGVYLTGVYPMGMCLLGVYLMGMHFLGVYLTGVYLMGAYLTAIISLLGGQF